MLFSRKVIFIPNIICDACAMHGLKNRHPNNICQEEGNVSEIATPLRARRVKAKESGIKTT
jgi:hypothetical protein